MKKIAMLLLILPGYSIAQEIPKHTNQIIVRGVSFIQVVGALLDANFSIDKKDDVYQTVRTEFTKEQDSWGHIMLNIRVKDSTAFITGSFYNQLFVSGNNGPKPKDISPIEYSTFGKKIFARMDKFAHSLPGQITYAKL